LVPKVLFSGHEDAVKIVFGLLAERKAMRENLLPAKKFLQYNKAEWDKLSSKLQTLRKYWKSICSLSIRKRAH
jgi:hypothetical protein